jgi:hypothetical protein
MRRIKSMADENNNPAEEPTGGEDSGRNDPDPDQGSCEKDVLKGGADGKTKGPGGKGLGNYPKTDTSERAYG